MSESYLEIQLDKQPIELYKLLKMADLVTGGGEAKVVISEGYVLLNGEVEYQKRKKVFHDDIVEFNGEVLQFVVNESLDKTLTDQLTSENNQQTISEPSKSVENSIDIQGSKVQAPLSGSNEPKKTKRKPISF